MRILATFAFSFAAAVFLAIYGGLDAWLPLLGGGLVVTTLLLSLLLRKKSRARTRTLLILSGLAVGFLWTALYMAVFFQPARELDGRTVHLTATVADWPQEGTYGGYTILVQARTERWGKVSAILYTDGQGAQPRGLDQNHCPLHPWRPYLCRGEDYLLHCQRDIFTSYGLRSAGGGTPECYFSQVFCRLGL